jgi:ABC-type branched-subunit amino acid transport system substrate-binding protein
MKIKKLLNSIAIFSIAFALIFCLTSCKKKEPETIKIGAILSLTGDAASYGDMMKKGMDIAVEEINAQGGINGKKLKIIYEDSRFQPKMAISAFRKLVDIDKVKVITGITGSKNALAVVPEAINRKIVIIDALSSSPELSKFGGKFYFRVMPSDVFAGKYVAQWSIEKKFKKAAVFFANDDWGNGILNSAKELFQSKGGQIVAELSVEPGTRDFKNLIQKLINAKPDIIFLFAYAPEAGIIVKQLRESGIKLPIIGSDNLTASEFVSVGAKVVNGVMFVIPIEGEGSIFLQFREKFKEKYGEYPSINSIKSYDVVKLAAYAIKNVGYDSEKISDFLRNLRGFNGASGVIEFDQNGDILNPKYQLMIYENGKYKLFGK